MALKRRVLTDRNGYTGELLTRPTELICWNCSHGWSEELIVSAHLYHAWDEWHALHCPKCSANSKDLSVRATLEISEVKRRQWDEKWKSNAIEKGQKQSDGQPEHQRNGEKRVSAKTGRRRLAASGAATR